MTLTEHEKHLIVCALTVQIEATRAYLSRWPEDLAGRAEKRERQLVPLLRLKQKVEAEQTVKENV
jgi:hypothetical protein